MKKDRFIALLICLLLQLKPGSTEMHESDDPHPLAHLLKTTVRLWTNNNGQTIITFWSTDEIPKKILELQMNYKNQQSGRFTFDGAVMTKGRLTLRAYGGRD